MSTGSWERDRNGNVYQTLEGAAEQWIAPVADDTGTRTKRYGQGGMALSMQADNWTGPRASDGEKGGPNQSFGAGGIPLVTQAVAHSQGPAWPAPAARDYKGANSADHLEVSTGSKHLDQLPNFVEHCFLPPSSPGPATPDGETCSTASPNSNQPSAKRKLNPIFVEGLMRWPTGLSGFARQETAWTRWWQLMPSFLSDLCSAPEPAQMDLFGAAA